MLPIIIFLVVDVCFILMVFMQVVRLAKYTNSLYANGERCEGVIVDMVNIEDVEGNQIYDALVEFHVNDQVHVFPEDAPKMYKPAIGRMVKVWYFKGDPSSAMVNADLKSGRLVLWIIGLFAMFIIINWLVLPLLITNYR
jgi:hypothetical protein